MSIDVMSAVWKLKDLADSEMLILLAMADWADKDGVCWPSISQLADKTNKGERTIQGAIKAIVGKGHLTRVEVPGRGCRYVVHPRRSAEVMQGYTPPETHYVYRIEDIATGEFYIGARTCLGAPEDDDYMGSGNWVKIARNSGAALRKVILEVLPSREALAHAEKAHVEPVFGTSSCKNAKLPTPSTLSRTGATPAAAAPRSGCAPQGSAKTPAAAAPNTSRHTSSPKATPSPKKRAGKPPAFVVPSDIPSAEWRDFEEMRRRIGKPMTPRARELAVGRLRKLADAGFPPGDVLNHSTLNNYQGLFPPKDDHNGRQADSMGRHRSGGDRTLGAMLDFASGAPH